MVSCRLFSQPNLMKTPIILLFLMLGMSSAYGQTGDSTAIRVVKARLQLVNDFLTKKETSLQKISEATTFLTDLTGISSESAGTYYGQFKPTQHDLQVWTSWLELNKDYIIWDEQIRTIILYKKVKPDSL